MESLENLRELVDVGGVEPEYVCVSGVGEARQHVTNQRLPLPGGKALPQLVLQEAVLVVQLVHLLREQGAVKEGTGIKELFGYNTALWMI